MKKRILFRLLCTAIFIFSAAGLLGYGSYCLWQNRSTRATQKELQELREEGDRGREIETDRDRSGNCQSTGNPAKVQGTV